MAPCGHLLARLGTKCPKCGLFWEDLSTPEKRKDYGIVTESIHSLSTEEARYQGTVTPPTLAMEAAAKKIKERRICQASFAEFAKRAWYKIPHLADTKLEWSWHHDALCLHLQRMIEDWWEARKNPTEADLVQKIRNLMVNIAPGTMKTLLVMVIFPCWVWTRYPRWTVRCVSSNPRSILESSDFARQLVTSDWYIDLFIPKTGKEPWAIAKGIEPWAVRDDKNAVSDWGNTLGGSRRSTGLSAAVTGEHTDWILCISGNTKVQTEVGEIEIKDIGVMKTLPRVWTYNTRTKTTELKRITKWMHSGRKQTVKVRMSTGEVLQCTDDHPIFTSNRGYIEAGSLVPELQEANPIIEPGKTTQTSGMQECLPCVRDLFEKLHPGCGRTRQATQTRAEIRTLLFNEVPTHHAHRTSAGQAMSLMPASVQPWIEEDIQRMLFAGMLDAGTSEALHTQVPAETLQFLSDSDAGNFFSEDVLLAKMQERSALSSNARERKFKLLGQTDEVLRRWTLGESCAADTRAGWDALYDLSEDETSQSISSASYRREYTEQSTREPDHLVRFVPHDPSQVERSTVLSIDKESECGRDSTIDVYDISVEDNHNFFANGILVHNCDDPHDAEQVNSEEMRTSVIAKWDNALFNRVNDGRVACRVMVMQRLRHDDLSGHIIERDREAKLKIWALLVIASEFEADHSYETPFGWKDPRFDSEFYATCEGLLDPKRFPRAKLDEELTRLTPRGYDAQHQQRPDSDTSVSFKLEWWSWYRIFGTKISLSWERPVGAKIDPTYELLRNSDGSLDLDWVCVSVDASGGSVEEGASAVGLLIVGGKGREHRFVLDDCTPGPRGFNDQLEDVKKSIEKAVRLTGKRSIRLLVEKKAYGGAVLEQMEKQIKMGDFGMVDGRPVAVHFEAYGLKAAMGSKEQRALGLEPDLFAGYVYIPEGAPWLNPFLAEFKRFPSAPNDRVDALVQVIERYRKRISWAQAYKKVGR